MRIISTIFFVVIAFTVISSSAQPSQRQPYQAPLGQRVVQRTGEAAWHVFSLDWMPDFITGRDSSQSRDDSTTYELPFDYRQQSRPGYRPQPTRQSIQLYHYIKGKQDRGEELTDGDLFAMQRMIANRKWPEAPEITADWQAVKDRAADSPERYGFWNAIWRPKEFQQTLTSDQVWNTMIQLGRMDYDTPHTDESENFRQYWHSLSQQERDNLPIARMTFDLFVRRGYDMRSDDQRAHDDAYWSDKKLQQQQKDAAEREAEKQRQEQDRWRREQEWFRDAWAREDRRIAEQDAEYRRIEAELEAKPEEPRDPRRIGSFTDDEMKSLLDCLCRASLGARPGVAQEYNLTIPGWADPLIHSCGSLGNGPCMASGWGCWRRFIKMNTDEARNCMVDAGLHPEDPWAIQRLDQYNRDHEEDLRVEIRVEPQEVCPGDEVRVSVVSRGGRGDYTYTYDVHSYFLQDNLPPRESTETSFTLTVDPGLKREQAPDGSWIYTRPLEAYTMAIRVAASSPSFVGRHNVQGRSDAEGNMRVVQVSGATAYIKLRAHNDCVKAQQAADDDSASPPVIITAPPVAPPPRRPGPPPKARVPGPGDPKIASQPPDQKPPADRRPRRRREPANDTPPKYGQPSVTPDGKPVPPEPGAPDQPKAGEPVAPDGKVSPPVTPDDPEQTGDDPSQKADLPVFTDEECAECLIIGGGMTGFASLGGASGSGNMDLDQQKYYYVEGCPGQAVRITVVGSDGWTDSAESVDGRATVYRPLGGESGVDEILVENLSMPGCQLAWSSSFSGLAVAEGDSAPVAFGDLREAETSSEGQVSAAGSSAAMDVFSSGRMDATRHRHGDGLSTMQQQSQMEQAARAGDQALREAAVAQSAGGRDAQLTRDETARAAARSQRESSLANVLGEAVASGVQTGAEAFGSTLGSEAATRASASIFERRRDREPEAPASLPEKSVAPPAASAAPSPQATAAAPAVSGRPEKKPAAVSKKEPDKEPQKIETAVVETVTASPGCDFCSATDAARVTADGGSHMMCNTCKAQWTCSSCGINTLDIGGATYTAYDSNGNAVWSGSISRACKACSDKWYQEQETRWGR